MKFTINQERKDNYEAVYKLSFDESVPEIDDVFQLETIQHLISSCTNFYFHSNKENHKDLFLTLYHNKPFTFHYN